MAPIKKPPPFISTPEKAYEAWERYRRYQALSERAYIRSFKFGVGTGAYHREMERAGRYHKSGEGWAKALDLYLRTFLRR